MSAMTATDRRELRGVVRARMKVLRADIETRKSELTAEAHRIVAEKFRDRDKAIEDLNWRINQILDQAQKDVKTVIETFAADQPADLTVLQKGHVGPYRVHADNSDRVRMYNTMTNDIEVEVRRAQQALARQEAQLLETLSLDALETDAARAFLAAIPTVAELVPATRMREIEAQLLRETP